LLVSSRIKQKYRERRIRHAVHASDGKRINRPPMEHV
jgi:hypothetical protein